MTAFEYARWATLMAPSPSVDGSAWVAGVDHGRRLDIGHAVQFVDVANVLSQAPAIDRQRVVRLLSYPAPTAAH